MFGPNQIELIQIKSSWIKVVQIGLNWSNQIDYLVQIGSNQIKVDLMRLIGPNWIKLDKTGSN